MNKMKDTRTFMRIAHRYLGFFLAGIMAVYAISGIVLIYRDTGFLKKEQHIKKVITKNLSEKQLGKELKIREVKIKKVENGIFFFKEGTYNSITGEADYKKKALPFVLDKMTKLHKAESKNPLSPLNAFFGVSLLFFVVSSFWMFNPKTKSFKRGMIFTGVGLVIAIVLIII